MADAGLYSRRAASPPRAWAEVNEGPGPSTGNALREKAGLEDLEAVGTSAGGHSHDGQCKHGCKHSHSHGGQSHVMLPLQDPDDCEPMGVTPFDENIPKNPPADRPLGEWVHPRERALNEWYSMECQCGNPVLFPWLGYEYISCPACNGSMRTFKAKTCAIPADAILKQAEQDTTMLKGFVKAERDRAAKAKAMMERFKWMKQKGDAFEAFFFGKAHRYGNFKLYRDASIILAPSSSYFIIPILIIAPAVLFVELAHLPLAWRHVIYTLIILANIAIWVTHFTEPGILRKGPPQDPQPDITEVVNGHPVTLKWCRTCNIHRPPRASHCSECDVCVDRFDHHCHITGTCVGRRNFNTFCLFVFGIAMADTTAFVGCCLRLFYWPWAPMEHEMRRVLMLWSICGFVYTLITSLMMLNMAFNISYMIKKGLTTRELMMRNFPWPSHDDHPWSKKSTLLNAKAYLCDDASMPSQIRNRKPQDLEDSEPLI